MSRQNLDSNIGCSAGSSETSIRDLPEECLVNILRLVGNVPLPIQDRRGTPLKHFRVAHPLQCAFVCRLWRRIAPAASSSLSLDMQAILRPSSPTRNLFERFRNLTSLELTRLGPSWNCLVAVEHLAPRLETLCMTSPEWTGLATDITPLLNLLAACSRLRSLTMGYLGPGMHGPPLLDAWTDVLCTMPLLTELNLRVIGMKSVELWEKLSTMAGLQHLHLVCDEIPQAPCGRLPSLLRTLHAVEGGRQEHPVIGHLTGLESLTLECELMERLPKSLSRLSRLTQLTLCGMPQLSSLPSSIISQLSNLQALNVTSCDDITVLPDTITNLQQLRHLKVDSCSELLESVAQLTTLETLHVGGQLQILPDSIAHLQRLKCLELISCERLEQLPDVICMSRALEELEIRECPMRSLPDSVAGLAKLRECKLSLPKMEALPEGIGGWQSLVSLHLECPMLSFLPDSLCSLRRLETLELLNCLQLKSLPDDFGRLTNLVSLSAVYSNLSSLPNVFGKLSKLEKLHVIHNSVLKRLPKSIGKSRSLRELVLVYCPSLNTLPDSFYDLGQLRDLVLDDDLRKSFLDECGLDESFVRG